MGKDRNYESLLTAAFEILHVTVSTVATYVLTPAQQTVVIDATETGVDITIELPPLDLPGVRGKIYSIDLIDFNSTGTVLIKDSNGLATLYTLDTDLDNIQVYSDGLKWRPLAGTYT